MPEFIRSFQTGKMNKDLDERLVPQGQYRDALNLDLANSEGSNVGTLQNVKGNVELRGKISDTENGWQANYIEDLDNPVCIASIKNDINEKIYWFIASDNVSAIAELDTTTGYIHPILVDTNNILNFSTDYLITGVNIIDKFLFWTDDQTEPKRININKFKAGSCNFNTHTKIPEWNPGQDNYTEVNCGFGGSAEPNFTEDDITVIKKSPLKAPLLDVSASPFGNNINGTGITPVYTTAESPAGTGTGNFTFIPNTLEPAVTLPLDTYGAYLANIEESPTYYANSNIPNWNGLITFDVAPIYDQFANNGGPVWQNDDILLLNGKFTSQFNETFEYQLRVQIDSLNNSIVTAKILGISSDLYKPTDENGDVILIQWEVLLEEKEPMFEYIFPRFAYRWKYIDNEYSCFSPFSEVAFVGNDFKYLSSDGYNVGMTNNIRKLIINSLELGTEEVDEIEILYKESHNTTVYSVDSIKKKDFLPYNAGAGSVPTSFEIKSEIIGAVVQSNQILRPWDNVPRKAKSQEIVGNRIIYGNYLQNYNIEYPIDLTVSYLPKVHPANLTINQETVPNPFERQPFSSLKSIRTYQAGIVFKDKYGRETPVQTTKTASINIPILNSVSTNVLQITPSGPSPSWATHFKFFIKETSNQYYNLALDRFYFAEDGNVWLSFPSSERNKLDEETYLILKKQHDNNVAVDNLNRYKVLAIENEAPDFIKTFESTIARATVEITSGFEQDFITLIFNCGTTNTLFKEGFKSTRKLQIVAGANVTDKYDIKSGGPTGVGDQYTITLERPLGFDAAWLSSYNPGDNIDISILENVVENKQEFEGRFFAKINRDFAFDTNIVASFEALQPRYAIRAEHNVVNSITGISPGNGGIKMGWLDSRGYGHTTPFLPKRPSNGSNKFTLNFAGWPYGGGTNVSLHDFDIDHYIHSATIGPFEYNHIRGTGVLLRFISSTGEVSDNVYKIIAYERKKSYRGYTDIVGDPRQVHTNMRKTSYYTMDQNYNETFLPTGIQVVEEIIEDDNKLLTSNNPAIFETEPKEAIDLDLYYEASDAIPIANYNSTHELNSYYNCYSYGQGVESNRIRDDYNAFTIDKGPKVSAPLDEPYAQERRGNGLIFSQIFNSTSGINRLNQFIQAEPITKDLNPTYGTIQKLHTRQTDLLALCEDKIVKILANKDALFNADGNVNLTGNNAVLGQAMVPATFGEFGISKNPESFAADNYRIYFTDKNRGAVLRLSMDGVTDIAGKGMSDFFADNLKVSNKLIGSFDKEKDLYNITFDRLSQDWNNILSPSQQYQLTPECDINAFTKCNETTVSFKEMVDGWTSRKSFIPESGISLNNIYYTFKDGRIYEHGLNILYNNFYRQQYDSSFNVLMNDGPQSVKGFSTVNYTGTRSRRFEYLHDSEWYSIAEINAIPAIPTSIQQKQPGWYVNFVKTDLEGGEVKEFEKKEGKYFNYIKGLEIFNDCDDTPDGIGNPDIIDSDPQDYILTVTIDEGCSGSGGAVPDVIQSFVNIWNCVKPTIELNIENETIAQDIKCLIEEFYDPLFQNYTLVSNNATAFSYLSSQGLQVGTQMYNSLTNEPITTPGAYLFVGAGQQMSDLTVNHAGLDANNATVAPSTYYVMILDSSGQIASWTQYNTLAACEDDCMPDTEINFYWFRSPDSSDIYSGVNWSGYTNFGNTRYVIEENFTDYPNGGPVGNVNVEWRYNLSDGVDVGTKIWNYGQHVSNPCEFVPFDAMYLWVGSSTVDPNLALDPNDPTPIPNEYRLIKITNGIITSWMRYNAITPVAP